MTDFRHTGLTQSSKILGVNVQGLGGKYNTQLEQDNKDYKTRQTRNYGKDTRCIT